MGRPRLLALAGLLLLPQREVAEKCFLRAEQLGSAEPAAQALAWLQRQR